MDVLAAYARESLPNSLQLHFSGDGKSDAADRFYYGTIEGYWHLHGPAEGKWLHPVICISGIRNNAPQNGAFSAVC